jgi:hypothetical protein
MKQRLAGTLTFLRAAMYWLLNDESISFENIMVKETRQQEVKYFVETASSET